MNERKKIGIKVAIVFGIIMGIFLVINAVWFFSVKLRYMEMVENIDKVEQTEEEKEEGVKERAYEKTENGYTYLVKGTAYLHNSGFAVIHDAETFEFLVDDDGNLISEDKVSVSLYVWPEMFNGYSYGIDISTYYTWHQINVDENGEYIPTEGVDPDKEEELKQLLEENREEVDKLFELADEMWDIR